MKPFFRFFIFSILTVSAVFFTLNQAVAAKSQGKDHVIEGDLKPFGKPDAPQTGTYNIILRNEPSTLNPITGTDLYNDVVQSYIMDSLMNRSVDTFDWIPALAEKSIESADGKTITFHLRKGAKFHDGTPVTAEDVKFSFDVIFDPKYNAAHKRPYYENIEKAEVIDPLTIRFTVKEKYFRNFDTVAGMNILPKHFYGDAEAGVKKNKTMLGSGPYKIENYDKGQSIILVRNKDWWGSSVGQNKGRFNFERIRIRFIKEENVVLEALKKGELDLYDDLTPEAYTKKAVGPEWGKLAFTAKVENLSPKDFSYIGWNLRRELFQDRQVRVALQMLMNRGEMIKKFRFDMSEPATGPWYFQNEYADPKVKAINYDPKGAVEILKKVGWKVGKEGVFEKEMGGKVTPFRFTLYYGNKDNEKYYVLYQNDLKKVGIDMQLQLLEWNAMLKNMDEGNFDAVTLRWTGNVHPDPKQIWHSASATKGGSNFIGYKNPEVDKLIDEARQELDKAKRIKLLRKVYAKIAADQPYAWMFVDKYSLYARSAKVSMLKPTYKYGVGDEFWWAAP